jgi:flagellar basal-body rod modification protein FlgD
MDNTKPSSILATLSPDRAEKNSSTEDMQNRFLTLLVAQLENQDPLNPLENTEVTNQLAQMSTVQGIEQLNVTLNSLVTSLADTQAVQASTLIGKTVLVPGSAITLTDGEAFAGVNVSGPADTVTISILDAAGNTVQTQSLDAVETAGHLLFSWDGMNASGEMLENGAYSFKITATNGGIPVPAQALQLGTVSALTRQNSGNFVLDLGGLGQYDFADVQQVF